MEEKKNHRTLWIVLAVIVGLLVVCGLSAAVGGLAGYWAGHRAAAQVAPVNRTFEWRGQGAPEVATPDLSEIMPMMQGGALIAEVVADGPADNAGLRVGDMIYQVNGQSVDEDNDLATVLSQYQPGDTVELQVRTRGQVRTVKVELGENPSRSGQPYLGVNYRMMPMMSLDDGR